MPPGGRCPRTPRWGAWPLHRPSCTLGLAAQISGSSEPGGRRAAWPAARAARMQAYTVYTMYTVYTLYTPYTLYTLYIHCIQCIWSIQSILYTLYTLYTVYTLYTLYTFYTVYTLPHFSGSSRSCSILVFRMLFILVDATACNLLHVVINLQLFHGTTMLQVTSAQIRRLIFTAV